MDPAALPELVWQFQADMAEGRRLDLQSKHLFGPESAGKLQYVWNTISERQAIDAVERLLLTRGTTMQAQTWRSSSKPALPLAASLWPSKEQRASRHAYKSCSSALTLTVGHPAQTVGREQSS